MLARFTFLVSLFCLFSCIVSTVHAGVQRRPAIGGYQVGNVYPTGKTYLFTSAESAGAARCMPRAGSSLTGRYRIASPLGSPHPSYQADCEVRITPPEVVPPQYAFPGGSGYNLSYSSVCKNGGQVDDVTHTCALPDNPPAQPNSCGKEKGANEKGNPVDFSTGQKLQREMDYQGENGLNFSRHYMSSSAFDGFAPHWRHNFDKRMFSNLFLPDNFLREAAYVLNDDGTWGDGNLTPTGTSGPPTFATFQFQDIRFGVTEAYFTREDGSLQYHTSKDFGKTWATDSNVNFKLTMLAADATYPKGRFQLESPENDKEIYDGSNGALLEVRYRDGRVHTLSYLMVDGKPAFLRQVTDNFGRSLKFTWGGDNVLVKMTDPDQQEFLYGYDDHKLLTSVTWPDGLTRLYHYDEAANSIPTRRSQVDGFLTGISDEVQTGMLVRRSTYKYNAKGMPISTELAGGAEKYQFDYEANTVIDPLGTTRRYTFQKQDGVKLQTSVSQPAGAGCGAAITQKSYDADANIVQTSDYNGLITTYSYYPGNLPKSKTEGVGSADQRTTTREWHPVFRSPVKIAEPRLLTVYEYDSQGNIITTTEQATLDSTGAQGLTPNVTGPVRKNTATYNGFGQILTETEFRGGNERTTRYQYNPLDGNLESTTAPNGLITRFSNYNAHGDAGRIETSTGQITDMTYYPRRWIKSVNRHTNDGDSLITTYEYDSRGRILRETRSDGGSKIHNYDDAGRLINIADNIDNSIDFTLDLMGNRLLEQVRDPKGNLISQVRRTVDPLGRVQQAVSGKTAPVQDVPTTTSLTSTDNPVRVGYPLRIAATVSGDVPGNALPGNALPTGEVVFMEGTNRLAVQFLHDGKAMLDISNLPLGNHSLTAFYSGDNKNHPGTSSALVQVIQAGTNSTMTLTCPALSTVESTLTCSATMRAEGGYGTRLNGQPLKLREGNTVLATGVLQVADGVATTQLSMTGLAAGEHRFQAFYAGDAILLPNQSNQASHTVQPHAPQITRLSLSGPLDVGAIYEVGLPGLGNGTGGYATYTVVAGDTSLGDIARHLAENVQAVTAYQVKANGPTLTITGPDKASFTVSTSVRNRPILSEGEFFQQALAPRPGTSAHFGGTFDLNAEFGKTTTGPYEFHLSLARQNSTEWRPVTLEGALRPIDTENALTQLCMRLPATYSDIGCTTRKDGHYLTLDVVTPIGQTDWQASGSYYDSKGSLDLQLHPVIGAESTVLVPQPQIISVRPLGKVFAGAVYSITAGSETWRYTSSAQDNEASILNGLAAAGSGSQQYVPKVVTARYGILNLQVAAKTPVLPFTYSFTTSNYPVAIDTALVQPAR